MFFFSQAEFDFASRICFCRQGLILQEVFFFESKLLFFSGSVFSRQVVFFRQGFFFFQAGLFQGSRFRVKEAFAMSSRSARVSSICVCPRLTFAHIPNHPKKKRTTKKKKKKRKKQKQKQAKAKQGARRQGGRPTRENQDGLFTTTY